MTDLKNVPTEQLEAKSRELHARVEEIRAELRLVNDELAFRENLAGRMRVLQGLSPEDAKRLLEASQDIASAGGISSGERVDAAK